MKAIHLIGKTRLIKTQHEFWIRCQGYIKKHKIELHAFVMMSNHFHLLGNGENKNFQKVIESIFDNDSDFEFYVHEINNKKEYENVFKYILKNPAKARLVAKVEEWQHSNLYKAESIPINNLPYHYQTIEYLKWWLNDDK